MSATKIVTMPTSHSGHPSDDELELYSLGRLREPRLSFLEEHLLICEECRRRMTNTDEYVAAMRLALTEMEKEDAGTEETAPSRRPSHFSGFPGVSKSLWMGALAAVVLFFVISPWQWKTTVPMDLTLHAYRGDAASLGVAAPAKEPLRLHIDVSGLPERASYRVEVVNAGGKLMFGTEQAVSTGDVTVKLDSGFPAGQYWVRVYEPATSGRDRRGLLREFSLRIE